MPKKSILDGDLYNRYTKFDHAFNEIHGYLFGNQVLQRFGRYILDHLGDRGDVYRLDGTKFAILSTSLSIRELAENYEAFRTHFREGFVVDDKGIILDLNGGLFSLDDFSVDVQTAFTCLNYAYAESKVRRNGDLVEFYNDLTNDNQKQLEKLHIIRASILQNYKVKEQNLIMDFTDAAMTCGATVCVEGIETEGMCEVLRQYPVTAFQGYYFSRPLDFYGFLAWKHEREQMI